MKPLWALVSPFAKCISGYLLGFLQLSYSAIVIKSKEHLGKVHLSKT